MCPMCMTTAALIAAGATSAGGLVLLAVKKILPAPTAREERDGSAEDRRALRLRRP